MPCRVPLQIKCNQYSHGKTHNATKRDRKTKCLFGDKCIGCWVMVFDGKCMFCNTSPFKIKTNTFFFRGMRKYQANRLTIEDIYFRCTICRVFGSEKVFGYFIITILLVNCSILGGKLTEFF